MTTTLGPLLRHRWQRLVAGVGGLAALTLATGIELNDRRTPGGPTPLEIGQRVDLGPYAVTLLGAELHNGFPDDGPSSDKRVLWVRARAENLTSATRSDLGEYLRAGGPDARPVRAGGDVGVFLLRDGTQGPQLQPGLAEEVALAAPDDGTARVTLFSATWKPRDALEGFGGWYNLTPKASATLKDLPEAAP